MSLESRLAAAEKLYEAGVARKDDNDTSGAYWAFKECVAFFSNHAECHRELGKAAILNAQDGDPLRREAVHALKQYLKLRPDAGDRKEISSLVAALESGSPPHQTVERGRHTIARDWADPEVEFGPPPQAAGSNPEQQITIEEAGLRVARDTILIARELRTTGSRESAVKLLERFFANVPRSVGPDLLAELWCALGLAYATTGRREQALQAYTVGIEQYPYYPDCHYFVCRDLGTTREGRDACERYLVVAPNGRFAADATRRCAATEH